MKMYRRLALPPGELTLQQMLPDPQSRDLEDRPDWQPLLESVHRPRKAREFFCVPRQVSLLAKGSFFIVFILLNIFAHSSRSSSGKQSWARLKLGHKLTIAIKEITKFFILQVLHIVFETFWESQWQATELMRENNFCAHWCTERKQVSNQGPSSIIQL